MSSEKYFSYVNEGKMFINNESTRVVDDTTVDIRFDILNVTRKRRDDGQILNV